MKQVDTHAFTVFFIISTGLDASIRKKMYQGCPSRYWYHVMPTAVSERLHVGYDLQIAASPWAFDLESHYSAGASDA
jgi:hypothetical protein